MKSFIQPLRPSCKDTIKYKKKKLQIKTFTENEKEKKKRKSMKRNM